jgi:hypothetical protein
MAQLQRTPRLHPTARPSPLLAGWELWPGRRRSAQPQPRPSELQKLRERPAAAAAAAVGRGGARSGSAIVSSCPALAWHLCPRRRLRQWGGCCQWRGRCRVSRPPPWASAPEAVAAAAAAGWECFPQCVRCFPPMRRRPGSPHRRTALGQWRRGCMRRRLPVAAALASCWWARTTAPPHSSAGGACACASRTPARRSNTSGRRRRWRGAAATAAAV